MYEFKSLIPLLILIVPSLAAPEAKPQWPWQNQPQQKPPQQGQQGPYWNQGQGIPQQLPSPGFNPYQPVNGGQQPGPYQTTVWIPNPNQQVPRPTPTSSDDDEPRWTPPPQWGPKSGRQPFGPKSNAPPGGAVPTAKPQTTRPDYCTNKDLICTTTIEPPREPAPYKVTCGRTLFLEDDVSNALTSGCYYLKNNKKIGNSEFPKAFENRQNFDFGPVGKGPGQTLWEMPLIGSAAYAGGPVGPDRVIFSYPECFLAGGLTQNQNGYTECTEQY